METRFRGLLLLFICCSRILFPQSTEPRYSTLIDSRIQRLRLNVERIRSLVDTGTLPRVRLAEAEEQLADARDEGVLAQTLYGSTPMDKFTEQQATAMIEAARRRVDRQQAAVDARRKLLDAGAIARSEFDTIADELANRQRVLVLAQNRRKLLGELKQMAETEQSLIRAAAPTAATLATSMTRFNGNGAFSLNDMPAISSQFERRFHQPLPISALGQTLLHQSLGLDHRNRVDIALNPAGSEGVWLLQLLQKLHVPYLAFTSAVAGAATAPHIHIGVESTHLKPGGR